LLLYIGIGGQNYAFEDYSNVQNDGFRERSEVYTTHCFQDLEVHLVPKIKEILSFRRIIK
jgi:hypothetical protein